MFHAVCLSWLFFRAQSMTQVGNMLQGACTNLTLGPNTVNWAIGTFILCLPLWMVQFLQVRTGDLDAPLKLSLVPRTALYAVVLAMLLSFGNTGGQPFIYFQF